MQILLIAGHASAKGVSVMPHCYCVHVPLSALEVSGSFAGCYCS